ncbi:MAG: hypothetical protein M0O99_01825, partial [Desulfuromonas thiophila]|nr:hypothetical protein [Desulfuromonas thiophila]
DLRGTLQQQMAYREKRLQITRRNPPGGVRQTCVQGTGSATMNVLRIPFCRPCGLTFQVDTRFRVEAREFKQMLHQLSGIAPEKDTCISVND